MEWAEIKRRLLKEGTSVQVLADLEAVPYKTMYNRIMAHQVKDGVTYLTPENTKGMKKAKAISNTKQKQAKEKEKAAGLPENMSVIVTNDYSCKGCAHCMQTSFNMLCEMGHECSENCVCSDYKTFPEPAQEEKPEFLQKKMNLPEDPGKLPEVVPKLPEDIDSETIAAVLIDINRTHADAVKTLHECEEMLEQARKSERQLRTLLIAMEQLAKGRKLPEVQ